MVDLVLRAGKGSPLTHEEMDANWKNLATAIDTKAPLSGDNASGVWDISVLGNSDNVDGVVQMDHGGTGADNPTDALTNLGAYPASNPENYIKSAIIAQPNGLATLDATGKLTTAQIPVALVGALQYQGTWDAANNSPIIKSSIGVKGQYYKVNTEGTTSINGQNYWQVGDMIIYNGNAWDRIEGGPTEVTTVAGRTGDVVIVYADIADALQLGTTAGAPLGTAAVGVAPTAAHTDHVHDMPVMDSLANVTILSKTAGDMLLWSGGTWRNMPQSSLNVGSAAKLTVARIISANGDASGSTTFDGSGNVSMTLALANSGVVAGAYGSATEASTFTVDAKGRLTIAGSVLITPAWGSITGKPTTIGGYGITDALQLGAVPGYSLGVASAGVATTAARSDHTHALPNVDVLANVTITNKASGDILKWNGAAWVNVPQAQASVATADKLSTARTISATGDATGSTSFDGSANVAMALTFANSGVAAGTYGSASTIPTFTVDSKGRVTSAGMVAVAAAWANITGKPTTLGGYGITDAVNVSTLGAASGVATLGADGKLTTAQIPAALVGALVYQGTWNAAVNNPALASGVGTKGQYYKVNTNGSYPIDGQNSWFVGDMIVFNGTTWDRIDGGATEVVTVAGRVGNVVLTSADIGGLAASATTDTTNAGNISAGTLPAARMPALTGDVTSGAGSTALTLANTGVGAGSYGTAGVIPVITVDAKGRVTNISTANVSIPWSSVTAHPTTLGGYGITDAQPALGYTAAQGANFATGTSKQALNALDLRAMANPAAGLGYASGGRFRFAYANDVDGSTGYADVLELSTYTDNTGGGYNALYLNKNSQKIQHKFAAADATGWSVKTIAYTDSNITGNAASASSVPWSGVSGKPTTLGGYGISDALGNVNPSATGSMTITGAYSGAGTNLTGKAGGLSIGGSADSVAVTSTNEMTLANGFGGGTLWMNYRGAGGAIGQVNVADGRGTGALTKIVASNIDVSGNTTGTSANTSSISNAISSGQSYTFTGVQYFLSNKGATSTIGSQTTYALEVYSTDGGAAGMSFHRSSNYAVNMGLDPDNVFRFGGWSAPANLMQLDMSGNVTYAGDVTAFSDRRLKKDIVQIKGSLERLLKLTGVTFVRIDNKQRGRGFIAQNVLEVYPELVKRPGNSKYYSVAYANMAGDFVEALREVDARLKAIEEKQTAYEESMNARLAALEAKFK